MNKTAKNLKKAAPSKTEAAPLLRIITFNGKSYRLVDLENEWTLKQKSLAAPIVNKILPAYFGKASFDDLKQAEEGETIPYTTPDGATIQISKSLFESMKRLVLDLNDVEFEAELLALLYIDEDEERFDKSTYESRIEEFENVPDKYADNLREAIQSFFDSKLPSMLRDSRIYFESLTKAVRATS